MKQVSHHQDEKVHPRDQCRLASCKRRKAEDRLELCEECFESICVETPKSHLKEAAKNGTDNSQTSS